MINQYKVAEVIELGRVQDVVLGEKRYGDIDSATLEYCTRINPDTDY